MVHPKNILRLLVLFAGLFAGQIHAQGIDFKHITFEEALEQAKAQNKLIFIDFFTEWCGPCKKLANGPFLATNVGDFYNTNFINLKLDAEKEGLSAAKTYKVNSYPTLLYIDKNGDVVYNGRTARSEDSLIEAGKAALASVVSEDNLQSWQAQFLERQNDEKFLKEYCQKMKEFGVSRTAGIEAWLKVQTELEEDSPEMFDILMKNLQSLIIGGKAEELFRENKSAYLELANKPELRQLEKIDLLLIRSSLSEAYKTQNANLLNSCIEYYNLLTEKDQEIIAIEEIRLDYLLMTKQYELYRKESESFIDSIMNAIPVAKIHAKDRATYEKYVEWYGDDLTPLRQRMLNSMKLGDIAKDQVERIEKTAQKYLRLCPDHGDFSTLNRWIDYCYQLIPDFYLVDNLKANVQYKSGEYNKAIALKEKALANYPEYSKKRVNIAYELSEMKEGKGLFCDSMVSTRAPKN